MKQYVIDELRPEDFRRVKTYLEKYFSTTKGIDGVYWVALDEKLLAGDQIEHHQCKPFYFALELVAPDRLTCELLVRTKNKISCTCIRYADKTQRNWIIGVADKILDALDISI